MLMIPIASPAAKSFISSLMVSHSKQYVPVCGVRFPLLLQNVYYPERPSLMLGRIWHMHSGKKITHCPLEDRTKIVIRNFLDSDTCTLMGAWKIIALLQLYRSVLHSLMESKHSAHTR